MIKILKLEHFSTNYFICVNDELSVAYDSLNELLEKIEDIRMSRGNTLQYYDNRGYYETIIEFKSLKDASKMKITNPEIFI